MFISNVLLAPTPKPFAFGLTPLPHLLLPHRTTFSSPHPQSPTFHLSRSAPNSRSAFISTKMGIKGLTKLLGDNAPRAIVSQDIPALFGRKIAIDASMSIYQLLVAVRMGDDNMTNEQGTVTSHLNGLFYRTIRLLELGVKPVYVFDGKPPNMKAGELLKRAEAKKAAEAAAKKAREDGDHELADKYARRVNRVTPEMIAACKRLISLMGVPFVEAPCEAEAQCAELVKNGDIYATASEDMDSLTFGTSKLIRQLWSGTASNASKKGLKPTQFSLDIILEDLELSMAQFVDLCILCGCDYADTIKGVGVVKALKLIREHGDLEKIVHVLRTDKAYSVPQEYPVQTLRDMFVKPEVTPASEVLLKWSRPDLDGLRSFMVTDNQFDAVKVENGIKRLLASKKSTSQVRVDSFFKRVTAPNEAERAAKRKAATAAGKADKVKAKGKRGASKQKGNATKKTKP